MDETRQEVRKTNKKSKGDTNLAVYRHEMLRGTWPGIIRMYLKIKNIVCRLSHSSETYVFLSLIEAVVTDLILYRICLISLNINATNCSLLHENASSQEAINLEIKIEPHASLLLMIFDFIENVLPGVIALFLGPWIDRIGRKPVLLAGFSGFVVRYAALASIANWNINPWYFSLTLMPTTILGGHYTLKVAYLCYIFDTSEGGMRLQLTLLEASINSGLLIGSVVGRLLYENYGHASVFGTAAICCTLSVVWTQFFIPETAESTPKESIKDVYKISFIKKLTKSPTKQENYRVCATCLAILILTLYWVISKGQTSTEFLFTRARLGWDVQHLSNYIAGSTVVRIIGTSIVSLRGRLAGAPDTFLLGIAFISALSGALTKSLAWQSWHMYLAVCAEVFIGITEPVLRSVISKFVPAQDISKVFTFTGLLELLSSMASTPLYTLIYTNYLPPIYPSPVFILSVILYIVLGLSVIGMEIMIRKSRKLPTYIAAAQEDLTSQL